MYAVLKLGRKYNLSIKCLLSLFDKMVKPILLYGCEIWGFGNNDVLEKVHLKFCKMILNLKTSTPNYMIYDELGRYPVEIDINPKYHALYIVHHTICIRNNISILNG